jgi:acyl-CoA reductase-like NAD-dependent aldehyde dehydrogenase
MNVPAPKFMIEGTWRGRLFGAEWHNAAGGSLDVIEPATGATLTRVGNATATDVRRAAAEARAAQPGWAATPYEKRAAILRKAARVLEDNQEELIPWIARETGGIPAKAGFEIHMVTEILYRSAAMCTEPQGLVLPSDPGRISIARRMPRGVIGVISPFNFPLILSTRAVAPALATGNAVVLKPDPRTALTGGFIIARIFEEAELPKGVLQVLPGGAEAGEAICTDPDIAMVSFTGSSNVGRRIGELAGKHLKKVQLELGGKNAVVVLEDADLDAAASAIAFGAWFHQGQICMTTGRVLANHQIAAPLTEKLVAKAKHLPVGDPLGQVALGPVISRGQVERFLRPPSRAQRRGDPRSRRRGRGDPGRERRRQDYAPQRRRRPAAALGRFDPLPRQRARRPGSAPHRRTGYRHCDRDPSFVRSALGCGKPFAGCVHARCPRGGASQDGACVRAFSPARRAPPAGGADHERRRAADGRRRPRVDDAAVTTTAR